MNNPPARCAAFVLAAATILTVTGVGTAAAAPTATSTADSSGPASAFDPTFIPRWFREDVTVDGNCTSPRAVEEKATGEWQGPGPWAVTFTCTTNSNVVGYNTVIRQEFNQFLTQYPAQFSTEIRETGNNPIDWGQGTTDIATPIFATKTGTATAAPTTIEAPSAGSWIGLNAHIFNSHPRTVEVTVHSKICEDNPGYWYCAG
ncbi:hypothetical protein LQL77_32410 [Rhodococcus cerastii]|nr:hypothetical protein [Rhodococcus cerastii]